MCYDRRNTGNYSSLDRGASSQDLGIWEVFLEEVTHQLRPESSQARAQGRVFLAKGIECAKRESIQGTENCLL